MVIVLLINQAHLVLILATAMHKDLARPALGLMLMLSLMLPLV